MRRRDRRRALIPQPSSLPLFVVAGLPKSTVVRSEGVIRVAHPKPCSVIYSPASTSDNRIYNDDYINQLLKTVVDFVAKRRTAKDAACETPSFVYLLYVGSRDSERLLRGLDFAVFPIEMPHLGEWDTRGRMRRHDHDDVAFALEEATNLISDAVEIAERWKARRSRDAMLLPPVNFQVDRERQMARLFLEMRQGNRGWGDRFEELTPRQFSAETLPDALDGEQYEWCFQDHRSIVFLKPKAPGFHGGSRETLEDEPVAGIDVLRGLYRFGAPIPGGFQHDAQYEGGRSLNGVLFNCCRKGEVKVSGSHANVYANDFVRLAKK